MIRTKPQPVCPVCSKVGELIYKDLKDELYGAEGIWQMTKCQSSTCNTYWLDPAPTEDDLYKLYTSYSTHVTPTNNLNIKLNKDNLFKKINKTILHKKLNYPIYSNKILNNFLYLLSFLHPAWQDSQLASVFYLPYKENGKLLDIGCGNGSSMLVMQEKGWQVQGIDFDNSAIEQAKLKGLNVSTKGLQETNFPDNYFDAIIMNHVIEHVPDPKSYLKECLRILKPNGVLVAMTPNTNSLGHKLFKQNWRGLEIPRHLQIFSTNSLRNTAEESGFNDVTSFTSTQGILQIFDESRYRQQSGNFLVNFSSTKNKYLYHIRWFLVGFRHKIFPNFSEVAVLKCTKSDSH